MASESAAAEPAGHTSIKLERIDSANLAGVTIGTLIALAILLYAVRLRQRGILR